MLIAILFFALSSTVYAEESFFDAEQSWYSQYEKYWFELEQNPSWDSRIKMAYFYLHSGCIHEAVSVVKPIDFDSTNTDVQMIRGIAFTLMSNYKKAYDCLHRDCLDSNNDSVMFWREYTNICMNNTAISSEFFKKSVIIANQYCRLKNTILMNMLCMAVYNNMINDAIDIITAVEYNKLSDYDAIKYQYYNALIMLSSNQDHFALDTLYKLSQCVYHDIATKAEFKLIAYMIQHNKITPNEAITRLEKIYYIIRGSELFNEYNDLLFTLYDNAGLSLKALTLAGRNQYLIEKMISTIIQNTHKYELLGLMEIDRQYGLDILNNQDAWKFYHNIALRCIERSLYSNAKKYCDITHINAPKSRLDAINTGYAMAFFNKKQMLYALYYLNMVYSKHNNDTNIIYAKIWYNMDEHAIALSYLNDHNIEHLLLAADIYEKLSKPNEALKIYDRLLTMMNGDIRQELVLLKLSSLLIITNQYDKLRSIILRHKNLVKDKNVLQFMDKLYDILNNKKYDELMKHLDRISANIT